MQRLLYIGTLVIVLLGSFLLTLWITGTGPSNSEDTGPVSKRLAARQVSDYSELRSVARNLGLTPSQRIKGNIDAINRINEREVAIAGWLADVDGDATPLDIIVFVAGRARVTTQTKGERADVTHLMGLAFGAEKNVAFAVNFSCGAGEQPVIVGLGTGKHYLPLPAGRCP